MGTETIFLTYHESGMGTPPDLAENGISWRMEDYYDLAMAGAAVNGIDRGSFKMVTKEVLGDSALPELADIVFTPLVTETGKSAEITVDVTPNQDLPASTVLHLIMTEREINYKDVYDFAPPNGQTVQYDVVMDFLVDSAGYKLGAVKSGVKSTVKVNATCDATYNVADSMQVVAIVQNEETKEIYAAKKLYESPFYPTAIITNTSTSVSAIAAIVQGDKVQFRVPEKGAEVALYSLNGREMMRQSLQGISAGSVKTLHVGSLQGVFLLRMFGEGGMLKTEKICIP